jgi:hypothetical protein
MIVNTLDGRSVKWLIKGGQRANASQHHLNVKEFLSEVYPTLIILEEVSIPASNTSTLYLDFYLPLFKIAVEADGNQHQEYNQFFYSNKLNFNKAQANDRNKENWCELNNIKIVRLLPNESRDDWYNKFL